jgi:hypothetical protein
MSSSHRVRNGGRCCFLAAVGTLLILVDQKILTGLNPMLNHADTEAHSIYNGSYITSKETAVVELIAPDFQTLNVG